MMIVAIIALRILLPPPGSGYTGKKEKNWCPPHVWVYDETGFLICSTCNNRPGYNPRE